MRQGYSRHFGVCTRECQSSGARARSSRKTSTFLRTSALLLLYQLISVLASRIHTHYTRRGVSPFLTFAKIGKHGRLGNQLFQIAATIGVAETQGFVWKFPTTISETEAGRLFQLSGSFELKLTNLTFIEEADEIFDHIDLNSHITSHKSSATPPVGLSLHGYYQSLKYFEKHIEHIAKLLRVPNEYKKRVLTAHPEIESKNCVTIHVRRGDYYDLAHIYNVLSTRYYIEALAQIPEVEHVIVVSDDIPWCRQHIGPIIKVPASYSNFTNQLDDFVLLYLGQHVIIANSTFSWWAAFLRHIHRSQIYPSSTFRRKTIAPKVWFNPTGNLKHLNNRSMYLESWIVIDY